MAGLTTVSDDWQSITTNDIITGLKYNTDFVSGGVEPVYFIADKSITVNYSNDSIQNCTKILANLMRSNENLTIKLFDVTGDSKYTVGKASDIQYVARYIDSYLETITNTYTATVPLDVSEKIGKYDTRFTSNALGGQLICRITSDETEYLRAFDISSQTITLKDIVTGANSGISTLSVNDRFELINAYDVLEEGLEETTGYPVQGFVKKHVKPNDDTSYIEFGKYDTPYKLAGDKVVIAYNALDDYNQTFIYDDSIYKYGIFPKNEELNFSVTQAQINQVEATLKKFTEPKITIDLETFRPTRPQKGWYVNVNVDGLVSGIFKIVNVSDTYIHYDGQLIDKPFRLWKVRLTNYENNLASVLAGLKRRSDLGKSKLATNQVLRTAIDLYLQFSFIDDPSEFGLDAPTALDATSINTNDFTSNWTAVPNANDYIIFASLDSGFTTPVLGYAGLLVGNVLSRLIDGSDVTNNDSFYFKVKAVNTDLNLESDWSNTITVNKIVLAEKIIYCELAGTGNYRLVKANNDNTSKTYLTPDSYTSIHPRASHDGTKIVFIKEYSASKSDLMILDLVTNTITNLTNFATNNNYVWNPSFNNDDTKILYAYHAGSRSATAVIKEMTIATLSVATLYTASGTTDNISPEYNTDNTKLYFSNTSGLVLFDIATSGITIIDAGNEYFATQHPTQNKIIYSSSVGGINYKLVERDLGANTVADVYPAYSYNMFARYSPDGNSVIWSSLETGIWQIKKKNLITNSIVDITANSIHSLYPEWANIFD